MAADSKVTPLAWDADRLAAMLPSVAASPWPMEGPGDVLGGSLLYEFEHGGSHALLAVRPVALAGGRRLDVVGLVSDGDRMRGAAIDGAAVSVARSLGCQAVAMCTVHQHVVNVCKRQGWFITGAVMAKELFNVQ